MKLRVLLLSLCLCGSAFAKPNVLFIAVDDLNDWVGYLGGHPQAITPNIDRLASKGVAFEHAYCPAPVCGPSRTALMYGIAPHKSGSYGHANVYETRERIPGRKPLNLVFQENGYYTAGCGKIFHFRETRGWDAYGSIKAKKLSGKTAKVGGLKYSMLKTDNDSDTSDGKLVDWAVEQLDRSGDKPFFLALGLRKPHLSWDAPKKYYDQFDLDSIQIPNVPEDDLDDLSEASNVFAHSVVGFSKKGDHEKVLSTPGAWRKLVRAYLATSSFADANVGRMLDALEQSPHRDNTIVVLWGDHGWHLGEKEHWKKMTLWERGTKTPFIIKVPGVPAQQVEVPVSLQDIFPTLVDLCGLEVGQELDGNSLKPLLTGTAKNWNQPVLMSHGPGNFAVRQGPWRLIHYADGSEELYQLKNDPQEFTNLANSPEHQTAIKKLRTQLPDTWEYVIGPRFAEFPDSFAEPPTHP